MEVNIEIEKKDEEKDNSAELGKIRNAEINKATNGWVVCYSTKELQPWQKKTDHIEWTKKEIVFKTEEEDAAFDKFKMLKKMEMPKESWY